MRLPHGYGTVYKLPGKRSRPYIARKCVEGIYETVGYYRTRTEGVKALATAQLSPDLTFSQLFEKWIARKIPDNQQGSENNLYRSYKAAYNHCKPLYNMKISAIRLKDLQKVIDKCERSWQTKKLIRTLLKQLLDYAAAHDMVTKNYAAFLDTGKKETVLKREPFRVEEIKTLWQNLSVAGVDSILFLIYTGVRIEEMLRIKKETVDLEQEIMTCGIKTDAGKDRIVPLHRDIVSIVNFRYKSARQYLFELNGKKISYAKYRDKIWDPLMEQFGMEHLPHDCRHTFITAADNCEINDTALKMIVGHALKGTTQKVYTHKDIRQLKKAMDLLDILLDSHQAARSL